MDLTDQEVAKYLRDKAKNLLATANMLDGGSNAAVEENGDVGIADILKAMDGRNKRIGDLSDALSVSRGHIEKLMTEENGFEPLKQGWYSHSSHN